MTGSSPHTRGAPRRADDDDPVDRIIPAYAGSTIPIARHMSVGQDHPRIRGEHPATSTRRAACRGSSPHTRGALSVGGALAQVAGIIPAYAGSTTTVQVAAVQCPGSSPHTRGALVKNGTFSTGIWDHPRIRGEHARRWRTVFYGRGSSPHTRGALVRFPADENAVGIIPAYAGSTQPPRERRRRQGDHPRIRGEHVRVYYYFINDIGIIPAYAGSTDAAAVAIEAPPDHPRIRGEHENLPPSGAPGFGSSPHTRGALAQPGFEFADVGIIPAYAGSTSCQPSQPWTGRGSSPHTRGAQASIWATPCSSGIIPAYAGSTSRRRRATRPCSDHPRIRGEHRVEPYQPLPPAGSSPHTRGALGRRSAYGRRRRIIPAYAGSTWIGKNQRIADKDHPRIRGEH